MMTATAFALNASGETKQNQPAAAAAVTSMANLSTDGDNSAETFCQEAARFRRLLEDQCEPIYCFQADFTLTFVNHAYSALLGKAPTELIGHSLLALIPPAYQPEVTAYVATLTPTNPVAITERSLPLSDGTLRWFEWTHRLLLNEHGQVVEYQGIGRDITARRQAEATAREQYQLSEALRRSVTALAGTLSLEAVLQQILVSASTVMPSDAAAVILLDGDQARMIHEHGYTPESADYFKTYCFPHTVAQQIRALNQPYLIPDTQSWPHWVTLAFNTWIRSSIGVPIVLHGQTIGLLVLDSATPDYFQPTDVDKLQTFAHYAALALANADHVRGLEEKIAARTAELQAANAQTEALLNERERTQRALVEERNLLRTMIDAIPATVYVKDRAHRFLLHNAAPIRIAPHLTAAELIGKRDVDYMPAALAEKFWAEEEALFQTGQPLLNQEEQLVCPDGRVTWHVTTKVPVYDLHGEITGLVGISQDITQRKAQDQQLRFYAGLQENVSDAVITTDLELRIQSWNRAAETIYGWRADEVMGLNIRELLQSEYAVADGHDQTIQALSQVGFIQGEVMQCHRDGRRLYILRSLTLLKDDAGRPIGLVSVGRDISERKAAERLLAEERNLLRTVIDTIPDVIFAKDRNHRFILRNSTLGHSGDVDPQSCLGKTDFDYFPPAAAAAFQAEEEAIFRTGQPLLHQETLVPRTDDLVVWASVTKVPLRNQQGEIVGLVGITHDITQRKLQEQQLRFYASLQENVSDAVITADLDLRIQSWNRAAETIYGWRADEVVGRRANEFLQTTYEPSTSREEVRQIVFQQGFWQGEVRQRHRNGQWLFMLRSLTLLKDAQGQPFGFVAVIRNITERKESERLLAEERNLLRTLIDAIPSTIYVKDRAHRFLLRNAAPSHIIRDLDISGVIGKTDFDYHPAGLAEKFWAEEEELFQTGQPLLNQELQMVHADGRVIWSTTTKVPLRNLHGEIIGLVGIANDITAYKRALATLATSEEKYRHLIEVMGSGFAIYDDDDNITYANERFCALLGYSQAELVGTSSYHYIDESSVQTVTAQLAGRREGKNTVYELVAKRKDGQRAYWLVAGSPLYNEQGQITGSFAVITDITLQKKAEDRLQAALKKEQELSELKSRFISMASHEFRTPLTSILLMTETLRTYRHRLTNEQIEQRLQGIQEQGRYLKTLMEDVLELASIRAGRVKFEPLPLALDELCRTVLEELAPLMDGSPRLLYQCDGPIPLVNLDKRLMRYIITNLVTNGLKYSPALTPVVVRLTVQDATLVLQVEDQGIGIPEADLPHLFNPFHRASNVGVIQGTGLGLVITKEAVELHGGTISVKSQLDVGTTFVISIPMAGKEP